MKKIFSTVAMAIVAFTAVVSMSSCQNDSPSSMNAAPVVPETTKTTAQPAVNNAPSTINYEYMAVISDEVFQLYDITITRTIDGQSKDYTLTDAAGMKQMMSTGSDKFSTDNGASVKITAKVTLKDNYQEVLDNFKKTLTPDSDGDIMMRVIAKPVFKYTGNDGQLVDGANLGLDTRTDVNLTEKAQFVNFGEQMSILLSAHN